MADNKDLWANAMAEVEDQQSRDPGLWARCYAEADGNEAKAKAAYIKLRVEQLTPAPTTGYCPNCNYELPLKADACPNCKAVFDHESSWAPTTKRQGNETVQVKASRPARSDAADTADPSAKPKGSVLRWVFGVPIALVVAFLAFGALTPSDPEKTQARRIYKMCMDDLSSADRARNSAGSVIAGVCENLRKEFIQKYGVAP